MLQFRNASEGTVEASQEYNFKTYVGATTYVDSEIKDQDLTRLDTMIETIQLKFKKIHDYGTGAVLYKKGMVEVVVVLDQGYKGIFIYDFCGFCEIIAGFQNEEKEIEGHE